MFKCPSIVSSERFQVETSGPLAHNHGCANFATRKRSSELSDARMRGARSVRSHDQRPADHHGRTRSRPSARSVPLILHWKQRFSLLQARVDRVEYKRTRRCWFKETEVNRRLQSSTKGREDVWKRQDRHIPLQNVSSLFASWSLTHCSFLASCYAVFILNLLLHSLSHWFPAPICWKIRLISHAGKIVLFCNVIEA